MCSKSPSDASASLPALVQAGASYNTRKTGMLNIEPIKLLKGSHEDTAVTGSGCFMNVIAYLNGEPQITDRSPCVCVVVRPIVIRLNDMMKDGERQALIPFIERAMGSATDDRAELIRRAWLAVDFANECKEIAADADANACAAYAAADAAYAAAANADAANAVDAAAAAYAAGAAYAAADAANAAGNLEKIIEAGMRFLDAALPKAQTPSQEVIARAQQLVALAT